MSRIWSTARGCVLPSLVNGSLVLVIGLAASGLIAVMVLLALRFVDPPGSAFIARERLGGVAVAQQWVPLDQVSTHVIRAVVNSEDARFCRHHGIDFIEFSNALRAAKSDPERGLAVRGASTITMQVVKNLFLWREPSYLRKGIELAITPLVELTWPKRRILEVYLNIAEWGPGIYGVEAASQHHFGRPADRLSRAQASLLAAALPNPHVRTAGRPGPKTRRRARTIRQQVARTGPDITCVAGNQATASLTRR